MVKTLYVPIVELLLGGNKMVKITEVIPNQTKLNPVNDTLSPANAGLFSPQGIKQFKDIVEGIRAMLQEAKELQQPKAQVSSGDNTTPNNGITKDQLFAFARQFLDSMIAQGYGNKTISEAIDSIPFTVSQIRGYLK